MKSIYSFIFIINFIIFGALLKKTNQYSPLFSLKEASANDLACSNKYSLLFKKRTIVIRIIFGYKDARPARFVSDRYERLDFIDSITTPCKSSRSDCGFTQNNMNSDLFTKEIIDSEGKTHFVNLYIINSSVGPDDLENQKNPFQDWKSSYAENNFFEYLDNTDVVFYNGHSRDGGGPDFMPPHLAGNNHVNYEWYLSQKKGVSRLSQCLKDAKKPPLYIGLFSCISKRLLPPKNISKKTNWITNDRLIYFADAILNMKNELSDLLSLTCQKNKTFTTTNTTNNINIISNSHSHSNTNTKTYTSNNTKPNLKNKSSL